jgi:hypothetical protein
MAANGAAAGASAAGAAAAAALGAPVAPAAPSRRRAREAHPDSLADALCVGNKLTPEMCCAICHEAFTQARWPLPACVLSGCLRQGFAVQGPLSNAANARRRRRCGSVGTRSAASASCARWRASASAPSDAARCHRQTGLRRGALSTACALPCFCGALICALLTAARLPRMHRHAQLLVAGYGLQAVVDALRVRCRFSTLADERSGEGWVLDADGCDAVLPLAGVAAHEATCGYELVQCGNVSAQVRSPPLPAPSCRVPKHKKGPRNSETPGKNWRAAPAVDCRRPARRAGSTDTLRLREAARRGARRARRGARRRNAEQRGLCQLSFGEPLLICALTRSLACGPPLPGRALRRRAPSARCRNARRRVHAAAEAVPAGLRRAGGLARRAGARCAVR